MGNGLSEEVISEHPEIEGVDLKELVILLWNRKIKIVSITLLSAVLSLVVSLSLSDIYQSEALLAVRSYENGGGGALSNIASQYGGLASLAGINIGGGGSLSNDVSIEILKSRQFFAEYLYEDVLLELMAVKSWNKSTGKLVLDGDIYDTSSGRWVRGINGRMNSKPTAQEAFRAFSSVLRVSENSSAGLVTLAIEHRSPIVAKRWVQWGNPHGNF